jgi:hypothetical protein
MPHHCRVGKLTIFNVTLTVNALDLKMQYSLNLIGISWAPNEAWTSHLLELSLKLLIEFEVIIAIITARHSIYAVFLAGTN